MLRSLHTTFLLILITVANAQPSLSFMGRRVTITKPELDETGFYPKGPASICLEGPERQCYTAPKDFGRNPEAKVVEVNPDLPALLLSVESGGVSGCELHFALLRPGKTKDLDDLFASDTGISCQSQHAFWVDPALSDAKIFVTADYVWGRDESHFSDHRYIISAFVFEQSKEFGDRSYYLEDRYMTLRHYAWDDKTNILQTERAEIIARLKQVKQSLRQ